MSDIQHAHLYGMREAKYDWLSTHDVNSTDWKEVELQKPFHLFIPQDNDLFGEYHEYWKIIEIFSLFTLGFKTHRDHFAVDIEESEILHRITELRDPLLNDEYLQEKYSIPDTDSWQLKKARKILQTDKNWAEKICLSAYRILDNRYCYLSESVMDRPRPELIQHALKANLMLVTSRQGQAVGEGEWQVIYVTQYPVDTNVFRRGANQVFPLYLYPDENSTTKERISNLSDEFLKDITNKLGYTPTPEAIFYYIYAIFHSPTYRTRYAEFLKIDFPRVPLTSDDQLFHKLGEYGEELVALHLMKSPKLDQRLTQINDKGGEFVVDAGHPKYSDGEVIINKKGDRFTGVPESVWEFYVGGYQVCHKWLKDRKGRQLSPEDLNHYQKIIVALSETMQIMNAIDAAIPSFPIE
jgi:predicted helicase